MGSYVAKEMNEHEKTMIVEGSCPEHRGQQLHAATHIMHVANV